MQNERQEGSVPPDLLCGRDERIRCEFGLLLGRVRNLGGLLLGL